MFRIVLHGECGDGIDEGVVVGEAEDVACRNAEEEAPNRFAGSVAFATPPGPREPKNAASSPASRRQLNRGQGQAATAALLSPAPGKPRWLYEVL